MNSSPNPEQESPSHLRTTVTGLSCALAYLLLQSKVTAIYYTASDFTDEVTGSGRLADF